MTDMELSEECMVSRLQWSMQNGLLSHATVRVAYRTGGVSRAWCWQWVYLTFRPRIIGKDPGKPYIWAPLAGDSGKKVRATLSNYHFGRMLPKGSANNRKGLVQRALQVLEKFFT